MASLGIQGVLTTWGLCVGSPWCQGRCKALCGLPLVTFGGALGLGAAGPSCFLAPFPVWISGQSNTETSVLCQTGSSGGMFVLQGPGCR